MTDKIVNIFNKQPVAAEAVDNSEVNETIDNLVEQRDSIKEILIIYSNQDDEIVIRSSNITRETAYFMLGIAQMNALGG